MDFVEKLASGSPLPGGGSAAAHCGACAVALLHKVLAVWNRKEGTPRPPHLETLLQGCKSLMEDFIRLQEQDQHAYSQLSLARKGAGSLPKGEAVRQAVQAPVEIMEKALQGMEVLWDLGSLSPTYLRADLLVSARILWAAHHGAAHIAQANLALLAESSHGQELAGRISRLTFRFDSLYAPVLEALCSHSRYSLPRPDSP